MRRRRRYDITRTCWCYRSLEPRGEDHHGQSFRNRHSHRLTGALITALVAVSLSAATVIAGDEPDISTMPSASPSGPAGALPPGSQSTLVGSYPLPDLVGDAGDLPTVSLEAESKPGWVVGVPQPYDLGHCGILSPVDVDGSLWVPVGGASVADGPIEDDEVGQLINATAGTLEITATHSAEFVSLSGVRVDLERAPGALDYFLCM